MKPLATVPAVSLETLRQVGAVNVTCAGIPFTIAMTASGDVATYVAICPHDWVAMDRPIVRNNCLVCPLHAATFSVSSGEVVDARGKRIREGLRAATTEVHHGQVVVHVEAGHYLYLARAQARRVTRVRKHFRKGFRRLTGGAR